MVAIGFAMLGIGVIGTWLRWRRRLYETRWFLWACMAMTPSGFVAVLTGWFTAEVGRQPWVVYGHLRTADAVSPVPAGSVATSLIAFFVVYAAIFGAGTYYMIKVIRAGYEAIGSEDAPTPGGGRWDKRPKRSMSVVDESPDPAEPMVPAGEALKR